MSGVAAPVWQLICHHEYCWGTIAADRSPWHSDGIPSGVKPLPGSQVGLTFSNPQSKIAIPRKPNDPWGNLRALYVEIIARATQAGGTLIHCDQSFRIFMDNQRRFRMEGAGFSFGLGDAPLGQWAWMSFYHNGFNQLGGGYSYPIPAGSGPGGGGGGGGLTASQVPGVGAQGVCIGNRIGNPNEHWRGDIALVRVWRSNPRTMENEFLGRPVDQGLGECWAEFLRKLAEALRNEPRCREWLIATMRQLWQDFFAALAQMSQDKIAEFKAMCAEYRELWRAGKVGSPEMLALGERMRDWLKAEGLFSLDDPKLQSIADNPCMKVLIEQLPSLDCDPDVQALIGAILGVSRRRKEAV